MGTGLPLISWNFAIHPHTMVTQPVSPIRDYRQHIFDTQT